MSFINLLLSSNGTYYVAPIPLGQAPVQVVAYQPPPGYALVPMAEVSWSVFSLKFFSFHFAAKITHCHQATVPKKMFITQLEITVLSK